MNAFILVGVGSLKALPIFPHAVSGIDFSDLHAGGSNWAYVPETGD